MGSQWLVALALIKFLVVFVVFFVYLPTKLFPQLHGATRIERFMANLVLMVSAGVVIVHVLALLQLYSIVSVLVGYGLLAVGIVRWRTGAFPVRLLHRFRVRNVVFVLDVLDRVIDPQERLRARARRLLERAWRRLRSDVGALVHGSLFALILAYAAGLRGLDLFRHASFPYSDPYSHLLWLKQLESGDLYPAGAHAFYPKGFHAFAAIMHGLTGLDETMTLRLVGPLAGTLLVIAAYYLGRRLTGNREAALVGMLVFGTFVGILPVLDQYVDQDGLLRAPWGNLGHWFPRQTAPLPEEFALVFLGPALLAAHDYLLERRPARLILFAASALTIFMTHSLVAVVLGVGLLGLGVLGLLLGLLAWRPALTLASTAAAAGVLGSLQLIYGALFAEEVSRAASDYAGGWLQIAEGAGPQPFTFEHVISVVLGAALLLGGLLLVRARQGRLVWGLTGYLLLVLVFFSRSVNFGVSYLLPPDRVGHYRMLFLCAALTGVFHVLTLYPLLGRWYARRPWRYQTLTAAALLVLGIVGAPAQVPSATRYEYDALARLSYQIKNSYPPLDWTIVSTVEDFSKSLKQGWHINVEEFLATYSPHAGPLAVPTPYTFLFVEKQPFGSSSLRSQASRPVRLDLERRLHEWVTLYALNHDNVTIYYEDWNVIVYQIRREPEAGPRPRQGPTATASWRDLLTPVRWLARRLTS